MSGSLPQIGDTVEVRFSALASGGTIIGSVTEKHPSSGIKVFCKDVIPGELALVRITETKGNFCEATLEKILEPSPDRITPSCPLAKECGGCDLQHIDPSKARELKRSYVESLFLHQAKIKTDVSLLGKDLPFFNYRNRITLHIDKSGRLGFYKRKTGDVIELSDCKLVLKEINDTIPTLKEFVSDKGNLFGGVTIEAHQEKIFIVLKALTQFSKAKLETIISPLNDYICRVEYNGKTIYSNQSEATLPYGHFSQVNEAGNKVLTEKVLELLKDATSITELYAGSGNFTFPLARLGKDIEAIELDSALTKHGEALAKAENLPIRFITSSTEEFLKHHPLRETVLLDPPRSGAKAFAEKCTTTKRIVYVSCNPATLSRDLKLLTDKGYTLEQAFVVDMFSETSHVETIVSMTRVKN